MNEENYHKHKPPMPAVVELVLLVLTMLFCLMFAQGLSLLWTELYDVDYTVITEITAEDSSLFERNLMRLLAATSNGFTFIVPALIFSIFMYRKNWIPQLGLRAPFNPVWLPWLVIFTISGFFFSQFTFRLNQMLPLPEWASEMEEATGGLIETVLRMESVTEFILTLGVVALIPALGEELIFRGIIQRRLEEIWQKPYLAILVSAAVFSFIHFQFAGFLPRMVLGLLLGCLYYWTRNLWMPILAHFLINGLQVSLSFFMGEKIEQLQTDDIESLPASQMLITAGISLIFIYLAGSRIQEQKIENINEKL